MRAKGVVFGTVVALILLVGGGYVAGTMLAPTPPLPATVTAVDTVRAPEASLELPRGTNGAAVTAIGMPAEPLAAGTSEPVPTASIAKLLTALTVLEAHPLAGDEEGPAITMGARDVEFYLAHEAEWSIVSPVHEGEALTQRQLLERALVVSSGNAADSLAAWAFGSTEAYLQAARDFASRHRLESWVVADASGISAGNLATPADIARVGALAYEHEVLRQIMGIQRLDMDGLLYDNTNILLGKDGVVGGKTGFLFASGANLLVFVEREVHGTALPLAAVVTGADTRETAAGGVLRFVDAAYGGIVEMDVLEAGTEVGEYRANWDRVRIPLTTDEVATVLAWPGEELRVVVAGRAAVPEADDLQLGTVVVTGALGEVTVPASIDRAPSAPRWWWRLTSPEVLQWWFD